LAAGETVYYMDGSYANIRLTAATSGSSGSAMITTTSLNGAASVTLTGNGTNTVFLASSKNYNALTNLTINGNAIGGYVVQFSTSTGSKITGCILSNLTGNNAAIEMDGCTTFLADNNTISNSDTASADGIYSFLNVSGIAISNNTITDCDDGIKIRGVGVTATNNNISSCVNGYDLATTALDSTDSITGGTIKDNIGSGILGQIAMTGVVISGVTFLNNGAAGSNADISISAVAASLEIKNCLFQGNSYLGFTTSSTLGGSFHDNIMYGTDDVNFIQIIGANAGAPWLIYNNTLDFNTSLAGGHAIVVQTNGREATIANNIIINRHASMSGGIIAIANAYNVIKYDYNHIYNLEGTNTTWLWTIGANHYTYLVGAGGFQTSTDGKVTGLDGTGSPGLHDIVETINPNVVNSTTHNYHLLSSSPCIDAGTDLGDGSTYLDPDSLNPDSWGSGWEIGAYQYAGPSASENGVLRGTLKTWNGINMGYIKN